MKLKKIFSILSILVVSLSIALQSCGKKDEPKKNTDYSTMIQGKWLLVSYKFDKSALIKIPNVDLKAVEKLSNGFDVADPNARLQFTSNAIISLVNNKQLATYKLEGNKIKITPDNIFTDYGDVLNKYIPSYELTVEDEYVDVEIKSLDNDTLVLKVQRHSGNGVPVELKFTRIK